MTEQNVAHNIELRRDPETPYTFETSADSFEAGILGGMAYAFCASECPARTRVEQAGLACPFMITEHSQGDDEQAKAWNNADRGLLMLGQVAQNTWVHCVEDVQAGREPVILLDLRAE